MKQKKIEHITLNLIVFGTIAIIGVLARQTVLHYGWDEFSSYLIFVVCSIVMGAIYLNLQMVFRQLLSPTIEKCFMRFECYRNKAVVVETSIVHSELAESTINSDPVISKPDPEIEIETTSDTEEVSILSSWGCPLASWTSVWPPPPPWGTAWPASWRRWGWRSAAPTAPPPPWPCSTTR